MTTEQAQKQMAVLRDVHHPLCIVCGEQNDQGLKVSFQACANGGVEARFSCNGAFQGYNGFVHGGVIASLLDGAMTNCLFSHGKAAVTGELTVRYLLPARANVEAVVTAWIKESWAPLHMMEAEMIQDGRVAARATAKFMESDAV